MVPSRQTPIRFTDKDRRMLKKLADKLGLKTTSAVVRHAIARLAEIEGIAIK